MVVEISEISGDILSYFSKKDQEALVKVPDEQIPRMLFLSINPNTIIEDPLDDSEQPPPPPPSVPEGGSKAVSGAKVATGDVKSSEDPLTRLLGKFEGALREKSIVPVRKELQLRLLKISSLELRNNDNLSTLESNFSDENDTLSFAEEDVLEFAEIFEMFQCTAPEGIRSNFTKIVEAKKIPYRRGLDSKKSKTFFVYAENKVMMKICNLLNPREVCEMYEVLKVSKVIEKDDSIQCLVELQIDPVALERVVGLKDVAFYYLILVLMRKKMLNRLYTHKLQFLFHQLLQINHERRESQDHIQKALTLLERYPIASRPPGLCIIFIMLTNRDGAMKDLQRVKQLFEKHFAYDVFVKADPTPDDVKRIVSKLKAARNKFYDSLVVWFMGHGDKTNLQVKNGTIHRRCDLIDPFTQIEWFFKKPKLFFIQACAVKRDRKRFSSTSTPDMRGILAETDSVGWKAAASSQWTEKYGDHSDISIINNYADTLISYATMWYQPAARHEEGSLFVDTLVDQLRMHGSKESIENVLRRVHYNVNTVSLLDSEMVMWKQAPYFESSLQKEFIFPKPDSVSN